MAEYSANSHMNMPSNQALALQKAHELYNHSHSQAVIHRFIAWVTRKFQDHPLALKDVYEACSMPSAAYTGLKTVDLDRIRGSESRVDDFDSEFNPVNQTTRERWQRIAKAFLLGEELPPVDLIQYGDIYYVRDGHHRVSVAHSLGRKYIEAEVTMIQMRKVCL